MRNTDELPVALGGPPVRDPGSATRTPIITGADRSRVDSYLRAADFQPASQALSAPCEAGPLLLPVGSLGAEQEALSREFTQVHGNGANDFHSIPVSNGTRAIALALTAISAHARRLGLRTPVVGDNVIVPALTWSATATAALEKGFVPRLADVDEETLCLDPSSVEDLVDDRTFAIIAVHLYNRVADLGELKRIADERGIALIEDCAHAHGARYRGEPVGTIGTAGTFSLQASKTLTCGEGGMITTRDGLLAEQLCSLANCGRPCGDAIGIPAGNDRLPGLSAALARAQLDEFETRQAARTEVWRRLDELATSLPGVVPFPVQPDVVPPTYKWAARYPRERWGGMSPDLLAQALTAELDVEVSRVYEPLNRSRLYQPAKDPLIGGVHGTDELAPSRYDCPVASRLYESVLVIEHAAALSDDFVESYAVAVRKVREHAKRIATSPTQ
jgi:dTDP-4-amino-4,6-dideoxygalactose transaminase